MKKALALLLVLCLLPIYALAGGHVPPYALIYSDKLSDRLNLRAKPSADSETLGRYYNGTVLEVLGISGDWARVSIGDTTGYMMKKYLRFFDHLDELMFGREMCGYETNIFRATAYDGDTLYVLADTNDDWLHVQSTRYGTTFRISRQDIRTRFCHGFALVISDRPEDRLNLRAEPQDDARVIGKYYAGTVVSVESITGGFAKVKVIGEGRNYHVPDRFEETGFAEGYMKIDYLRFGTRSDWLGTANYMPIATVTSQQATAYQIDGKTPAGTYAQGMGMLVLGQWGNGTYLHVDMGETDPVLIRAQDVNITEETGTGDMPLLGYGVIRDTGNYEDTWGFVPYYADCTAEDGLDTFADGQAVEVLSLGDTWAQVRRRSDCGYIPRENLQFYSLDELTAPTQDAKYTQSPAAPLDAGLYTYACADGETLQVTVDRQTLTYGGTAGSYTLYLSPEHTVALQGGTLTGMTVPAALFLSPDATTYQGSGRYLCGQHMQGAAYWEYIIRPLDPTKEASYTVRTLSQEIDGQGERVHSTFAPGEDRRDNLIIYDGEILEFNNCIVQISFGNG